MRFDDLSYIMLVELFTLKEIFIVMKKNIFFHDNNLKNLYFIDL